jgi:hypothetical protein
MRTRDTGARTPGVAAVTPLDQRPVPRARRTTRTLSPSVGMILVCGLAPGPPTIPLSRVNRNRTRQATHATQFHSLARFTTIGSISTIPAITPVNTHSGSANVIIAARATIATGMNANP